jgi:tetratricopeptide (TPR) repeat protein
MREKDKIEEAENNQTGAEAEASGDIDAAIKLYEKNIKRGLADSFPFDRLMVIYRKQKSYKEELRVINRAIEVFTGKIEKEQQRMLKRIKNKTQLKKLSTVLGKKTGLMNKKGTDLYVPAPVDRWLKRKEVVLKRMR